MLARHADPIAAIATAPGRGAVGIVRVSSPQDLAPLIEAVCGRALKAREATIRSMNHSSKMRSILS